MTGLEKFSLVLMLLGLLIVALVATTGVPMSAVERAMTVILFAVGMSGFIPDWQKRK